MALSDPWWTDLKLRTVMVGATVPSTFDLVNPDGRHVGDAKWLKNIGTPTATWSVIAEYIKLLWKVRADKVFIEFGQDAEAAERYLRRVRPLSAPVEFSFLDALSH